MNDAAVYDLILRISVFACATIIIVTLLLINHRAKLAKQETLQKLIESGKDLTPDL